MIFLEISVNYLAVVLAAVAFMILGFLWYSPILFAKPWMRLKGYSADELKREQSKMGPLYGVSFLMALLTAYVLYHIMAFSQSYYDYPELMTGLTSAFWVWLGFIFPTQVTSQIFGEKKWKLLAIDTGYQLAGVLIMGIVLASL